MGKIGLPLAVQIASKGFEVVGADISARTVELVNAGTPPFPGEADLEERLGKVVGEGLFEATTDTTSAVSGADVVVVVVPLMTDESGSPDFSAMDSASEDIAAGLQPNTLVSYETTLPVGTTRDRFCPILEAGSGLEVGRDLFVVHSPERVFSGRVFSDLSRYPKLVGGVDEESTRRGVELYESILDFDDRPDLSRPNGVWAMASAEAAEMAKLAETTYRDVNIALANEFATFAEEAGIDVSEVIAASNSQPYSHIHRPGVAVGGHCIPVYPRFYLTGHPTAELVETARRVNLAVPARAVAAVSNHLGELVGRTVLILGAAYRGGVKETAYSGVFDLARAIEASGGTAVVSDPLYEAPELEKMGLVPWKGETVDAVIVQADHAEYSELTPGDVPGVRVVFDGRAILDLSKWRDSDVDVHVIGQGASTD